MDDQSPLPSSQPEQRARYAVPRRNIEPQQPSLAGRPSTRESTPSWSAAVPRRLGFHPAEPMYSGYPAMPRAAHSRPVPVLYYPTHLRIQLRTATGRANHCGATASLPWDLCRPAPPIAQRRHCPVSLLLRPSAYRVCSVAQPSDPPRVSRSVYISRGLHLCPPSLPSLLPLYPFSPVSIQLYYRLRVFNTAPDCSTTLASYSLDIQ
jgi:hypothetical protein